MYLQDIKLIDMRFSIWDKKKSDPKEGSYEFDKKVYVDFMGNKEARPDVWFTWCRYDPSNNYRELREWKIMWGYTPVNIDTDPYWPESVPPDVNGNYVFGDLILVKCRLIDYLKRQLEDLKRSKSASQAKLDGWQAQMEKAGASIPESMIQELIG